MGRLNSPQLHRLFTPHVLLLTTQQAILETNTIWRKVLGFCLQHVHNKVISGFYSLRQAKAPVAGLEPATDGSMQISGRIQSPWCHQSPLLFHFVSTELIARLQAILCFVENQVA
ncbi:hypothetical protein PoB_003739900 [Plakobranchus ocellatus]|uniref:Uncharacterized protein n=1 Tax=Plakobranchus ocellatus TaxID=259542 RepID=A0AAV4ASW5_9GAST|nr:hypothetical protein PoB_003739900 [Plakobranchus ocellatus]